MTTLAPHGRPAADGLFSLDRTPRQIELFEYVFAFTLQHGYQPSVREMGEELRILSPNGIACHLRGLVRKGWIAKGPTQSRAIHFLRWPDGSPFEGFGKPA